MKILPAAALAVLLAAGACASPSAVASAGPAITDEAERIAASFAAAADAERAGNHAALVQALRVIDAAGLQPLEKAADDPLPGWREAAIEAGSPPYRGRPLGPGYRSGKLGGGGRESFSQLFLSGTGATIALSAPTGDRLGLRVLDPQAKPICNGDAGRGSMCKWVPLFTQRYTIEVTNLGPGDARYFLVVQ